MIKNHPPALQLYQEKLKRGGQLTDEEIKQTQDRVMAILNEQFEASKSYKPETRDWLTSYWSGTTVMKFMSDDIVVASSRA